MLIAVGKIPRPSPAMVVALVALLVATSGAAFAAIPSSSGTITTCYAANGSLRVINAEGGQTCTSTETRLSWKDGITSKVADSDKLDGKDSSKFTRASLFGSPVDARNGENPNSNCSLGEVRLFAGSVTPGGWKMARGQLLPINSDYTALYNLLGTTYGGNGETTFALPDLRGAEPNGAGTAAPNYAICTQGIFPS